MEETYIVFFSEMAPSKQREKGGRTVINDRFQHEEISEPSCRDNGFYKGKVSVPTVLIPSCEMKGIDWISQYLDFLHCSLTGKVKNEMV